MFEEAQKKIREFLFKRKIDKVKELLQDKKEEIGEKVLIGGLYVGGLVFAPILTIAGTVGYLAWKEANKK